MSDNKEQDRKERPFDVVVWGATGFTGQMAAEYLAAAYPFGAAKGIRYAIAGRNERKLQAVRASMVKIDPACANVPILTADIDNQASVDAMVAQTRVIVACAGPFTLYGTTIVDACVRLRTDYVDITGETTWVSSLIEKYHQQAAQNGVMIVPMCGFDSIPSDVGCFMAVDYAKKQLKGTPVADEGYFEMWGPAGPSGGTLNTVFTLMGSGAKNAKKFADVHLLTPPEARREQLPGEGDRRFVSYAPDVKSHVGPFIMAGANTRVVRRSAGLLDYGKNFVYNESAKVGSWFKGALLSTGIVAFAVLAMIPCTRWALRRIVTQPGDGPSLEKRSKSGFTVTHVCKTAEGKKAVAQISCIDPGYGTTAKMVVESGLTILRNKQQAPVKGGVLTASCIGPSLIESLRKAGMKLQVEEQQ